MECNRCRRTFQSIRALEQHRQASFKHNICNECGVDFLSHADLVNHWVQSPHHFYCRKCNEHFGSNGELATHYRHIHANDYCSPCDEFFENELGLQEHKRQSHKHVGETRYHCSPCNKSFASANNLDEHLASSAHHPKSIRCVFHKLHGCPGLFVSQAAMIAHLETGICSSGHHHRSIRAFVLANDETHRISDPTRLSADPEHLAYGSTWNGIAYGCPMCPQVFRTQKALGSHLASPRHAAKVYLCRRETCGARFAALSALCRHAQSGRCGNGTVKDDVDSILRDLTRAKTTSTRLETSLIL